MGGFISTSKIYNRNELLYANRLAKKYGISKKRYDIFLKSGEYELVGLNFSNILVGDVDKSYIKAWNSWKNTQSWGKKYSDLDQNLLVFLSNMPTSLNRLYNYYMIPKKHDEFQRESLIKFYNMQKMKNINCKLEYYVDNILDTVCYKNIVHNIKDTYNPNDWDLSQSLDLKWIQIIYSIRNSTFRDISNLNLIENLCLTQKDAIYDSLDSKIII